MINITLYDELYSDIKSSLEQSPLGVKVYKKPIGTSFPLVVIQEIDNSETTRQTTSLSIEVNIYTKDKPINGVMFDDITIARNINETISNYMNKRGFKRIYSRPTPNIDSNVYRLASVYRVSLLNEKNLINR